MRIIDGDALVKRLIGYKLDCEQENDTISAQVFDDCITEIQGAPTIEPKRGEWITTRTAQHDGEPYCSICGEEPYRKSDRHMPNFCPSCGADMGKEGEG